MQMAKRLAAAVLGVAVLVIADAVIVTKLSAAQQSAAPQSTPPAAQGGRGLAEPPVPCGPQGQLPANLSKNVAPTSRCFEVRIYTVDKNRVGTGNFKGGINELHQRFREKEVAIFQKHGAEIVGVWQQMGNPDTLVWMLAYRDRAHREEVWARFNADPEWTALRNKYPVPVNANTFMMSASDYSPMK
jgi:hypothetical protein